MGKSPNERYMTACKFGKQPAYRRIPSYTANDPAKNLTYNSSTYIRTETSFSTYIRTETIYRLQGPGFYQEGKIFL